MIHVKMGLAILGAALSLHGGHKPAAHAASCQTLTVVQQTYVHPDALAAVEYASELQSYQLAAYWDTPCVQFGPGGWPIYLQLGSPTYGPYGSVSWSTGGYHEPGYAVVQTAEQSYMIWARAFTHEVDEMLVDPGDNRYWAGGLVEVCDPVENWTYSLAGVPVTDFVLPGYFFNPDGRWPWDVMGWLGGPA